QLLERGRSRALALLDERQPLRVGFRQLGGAVEQQLAAVEAENLDRHPPALALAHDLAVVEEDKLRLGIIVARTSRSGRSLSSAGPSVCRFARGDKTGKREPLARPQSAPLGSRFAHS